MAPSFEQLDPETEYDDGEEDIDFSGTMVSHALASKLMLTGSYRLA